MKEMHRFVSKEEIAATQKAFSIKAKELLNSIDIASVWSLSSKAKCFVKRWEPLMDATVQEACPDACTMSARLLSVNIETFKSRLGYIIDTIEQGKVDEDKMIETIDWVQEWKNHDRETIELIDSIMKGAGQAPSD